MSQPNQVDMPPKPASEGEKIRYVEGEDRTIVQFPWEVLIRLRGSNKLSAMAYLAKRDGMKCTLCGIAVSAEQVTRWLEIDHIDENPRNNARWNLRLAHHSCNTGEYHRRRKHSIFLPGPAIERERKMQVGMFDQIVEGTIPIEIQKHENRNPAYRVWIFEIIQKNWKEYIAAVKLHEADMAAMPKWQMKAVASKLRYGQLAAAGAEEFGLAVQTSYNWLAAMRNEINGFLVVRDTPDGKLLDFRDPEYHKLPPEEIYKKHPTSGRPLAPRFEVPGDDTGINISSS